MIAWFIELVTTAVWIVIVFGGMFLAVCLLILLAVAIEYYIKKWRGKK